MSFQDILARYDYAFSPERIAHAPASPRDSAGLAVLDRATGEVTWAAFREIGTLLPQGSVLVLNRTKVIPARVLVERESGRVAQLLVLGVLGDRLRAWSNRRLRIEERLRLTTGQTLTVTGSTEREWILTPDFPINDLPHILEEIGRTPLPPYIKETPLSERELRVAYQSVFARDPGSIAAPTASLHFTPQLLEQLRAAGIETVDVTLHVHLGTFAPLMEEQWNAGKLHPEEYHIRPEDCAKLEAAKREGRRIIAVGTTAARTLESAADAGGHIVRPDGTTTLFIREGYVFRMIDGLVTNFHVPKSSLLMLVCAFAGRERMLALYAEAIERKMRFFSFGDAMLLL